MELRDKNGLTEAEFLAQYRPGDYPRPSVAADIAIFSPGEEGPQVLLIRRGGHPCLGQWALPGGFVEPGETVGQAAARELWEETGAAGIAPQQLFTFSQPGRDPRTWTMSVLHMAVVPREKLAVQAGDDAADAGWFRLEMKEEPEQPGTYSLCLTKGEEILEARVARQENAPDGPFVILENHGLAFDHPKLLALAAEHFGALPAPSREKEDF